jgi:hypothetical protein
MAAISWVLVASFLLRAIGIFPELQQGNFYCKSIPEITFPTEPKKV